MTEAPDPRPARRVAGLFPLAVAGLALVAGSPRTLALAAPTPEPAAAGTAASAPAPAAPAPAGSVFDEELAQRRARFVTEQARPQSAAALVPLLGLGELWELCDDRAAVLRLVTEAARPNPAVAPAVRAYALAQQRAMLLHQGDLKAAAAVTRELGVVQDFALVGPFDNDGRRGHAAVYAPEQDAAAPSSETRYEGKSPALPLRWRVLPPSALGLDGTVPLDAWLRPDTQGTAYAAVYVRSDRQQPVALRDNVPVVSWLLLKGS